MAKFPVFNQQSKPVAAKPAAKAPIVTSPVVVAAVACPACGSTERGDYHRTDSQAHDGVHNGKEYTHIVRRYCRCAKCGQQRIEREYEMRGK